MFTSFIISSLSVSMTSSMSFSSKKDFFEKAFILTTIFDRFLKRCMVILRFVLTILLVPESCSSNQRYYAINHSAEKNFKPLKYPDAEYHNDLIYSWLQL